MPSILLATYSVLFGFYLALALQGGPVNEPNPSANAKIVIVGATLINPAKSQVLENSVVTTGGNKIVDVA